MKYDLVCFLDVTEYKYGKSRYKVYAILNFLCSVNVGKMIDVFGERGLILLFEVKAL